MTDFINHCLRIYGINIPSEVKKGISVVQEFYKDELGQIVDSNEVLESIWDRAIVV